MRDQSPTFTESVSEFYDDTPAKLWKKVIGDDLHYHLGWGDGDIFYNSIKYLYQFIPKNSKILDCGCGWGGPAKVLLRDLNCKITGVTNSEVQYDYVKENIPIEVVHADLHEYKPKGKYDICLFVESFTHLVNPEKVLYNISECSDNIVLRAYHLKGGEQPKNYIESWLMNLYETDKFISLFDKFGFDLEFNEEHFHYALEPSVDYWLDNLNIMDDEEKTKHIHTLEYSSRYFRRYLRNGLYRNKILHNIGLGTFVFRKRK
jgi:hypothetical protein